MGLGIRGWRRVCLGLCKVGELDLDLVLSHVMHDNKTQRSRGGAVMFAYAM